MRIKYEYPCVFASIVIMLCASARSKGDVAPRMHGTQTDTIVVDTPKKTSDARPYDFAQNAMNMFAPSEPIAPEKPCVVEVSRTNRGLCYTMNNGEKIERCGGTIAWRNNNPGCIRYSDKVVAMGAIGKAYGFAIFPDEETGMRAIKTLLLSDAYCNLTISGAINKYAPPHENNTVRYINSLCNLVGVSRTTKLCELNDEQMNCVVKAIRKLEGWIVGTEYNTPAPKPDSNEHFDSLASIDKTKNYWFQHSFQKMI